MGSVLRAKVRRYTAPTPRTKQSTVGQNLVKPLVGSMLIARATSTQPAASKNSQATFVDTFLSPLEGSSVGTNSSPRGLEGLY